MHNAEDLEQEARVERRRSRERVAARLMIIPFVLLGLGMTGFALYQSQMTPERLAMLRLLKNGYGTSSTEVVRAVKVGDQGVLDLFENAGVAMDVPDPSGMTPLLTAVAAGKMDLVHDLMDRGAELHATTPTGLNAFSLSVRGGHEEVIRWLLEMDFSVDQEVMEGYSALHWTLHQKQLELATLLLERGADPNLEGKDGTPLQLSFATGQEAAIGLLLDHAADVCGTDLNGQPFLLAATRLSDQSILHRMVEAGADPNQLINDQLTLMQSAVLSEDRQLMEVCLANGGDLEQPLQDGTRLLEAVAHAGNLEWVRFLLDQGCDPNLRTARDDNPLWWEQLNVGQPEIANLFLEAGADVSSPDAGQMAPIDRAIEIENLRMVRFLANQGARPTRSIWYALESRNYAMLRLMLAHGAEANAMGERGLTPMGHALLEEDLMSTALLMEYLTDEELQQKVHGHSLLEWAVVQDKVMLAELLIDRGINPDVRIPAKPHPDFVELVESSDVKFYFRNDRNLTPLMVAAGEAQHEMVEMLLEHGASRALSTSGYHRWPINFAVKSDDIKVSQMLLGSQVDPEGKNRKIIISLNSQTAKFYENGEEQFRTRVSTGKKGHRTPAGTYVITNKHRHWTSTIYDSSMPYFMRLNCGSFGLHQGYVPNYPASHGCIRVPEAYARKFFTVARVGDVVVIQ